MNKLRRQPNCMSGGNLLVCIDEAGSHNALVRRMIAVSPKMTTKLKKDWSFAHVRYFAAGTGIEGEAVDPGTCPQNYRVMSLKPLSGKEYIEFVDRYKSLGGKNEIVFEELKSPTLQAAVPEVIALVENRRAADHFLSEMLSTPQHLTSRRAIHLLMRSQVVLTASQYYNTNGLQSCNGMYLMWLHSVVLRAVMFDHSDNPNSADLRVACKKGLITDHAFRKAQSEAVAPHSAVHIIPGSMASNDPTNETVLCLAKVGGLVVPRYSATNAVLLMLRCGFGVENAAIEYGEAFEGPFASYVRVCYLAVAACPAKHQTVETFLDLLCNGCSKNRPRKFRTSRSTDTPLPRGGIFQCELPTRIGSEASRKFFDGIPLNVGSQLTTAVQDEVLVAKDLRDAAGEAKLTELLGADNVAAIRSGELQKLKSERLMQVVAAKRGFIGLGNETPASVQLAIKMLEKKQLCNVRDPLTTEELDKLRDAARLLVVLTGYKSPSGDLIVVIPGYGLIMICCKLYDSENSRIASDDALQAELLKMCVHLGVQVADDVVRTKLSSAQGKHREFAQAVGESRVRAALVVCTSGHALKGPTLLPTGKSVDLLRPTMPLYDVPISYLATGIHFENLFPLLRPSGTSSSMPHTFDFPVENPVSTTAADTNVMN